MLRRPVERYLLSSARPVNIVHAETYLQVLRFFEVDGGLRPGFEVLYANKRAHSSQLQAFLFRDCPNPNRLVPAARSQAIVCTEGHAVDALLMASQNHSLLVAGPNPYRLIVTR